MTFAPEHPAGTHPADSHPTGRSVAATLALAWVALLLAGPLLVAAALLARDAATSTHDWADLGYVLATVIAVPVVPGALLAGGAVVAPRRSRSRVLAVTGLVLVLSVPLLGLWLGLGMA